MKFILGIILPIMLFGGPYNTGYQEIVEIKVWKSVFDIYTPVVNLCSNSQLKTRYLLDKVEKDMYSTLLSALLANKKVNINYSCTSSGYPTINGIRLRK